MDEIDVQLGANFCTPEEFGYFSIDNYFSELISAEQKAKARKNLGLLDSMSQQEWDELIEKILGLWQLVGDYVETAKMHTLRITDQNELVLGEYDPLKANANIKLNIPEIKLGKSLKLNEDGELIVDTELLPKEEFTELDPIFTKSPAYNITSSDIENWNKATNADIPEYKLTNSNGSIQLLKDDSAVSSISIDIPTIPDPVLPITYVLSLNDNKITLTGSNGLHSTITLKPIDKASEGIVSKNDLEDTLDNLKSGKLTILANSLELGTYIPGDAKTINIPIPDISNLATKDEVLQAKNVLPDWEVNDPTDPAYIKGKPLNFVLDWSDLNVALNTINGELLLTTAGAVKDITISNNNSLKETINGNTKTYELELASLDSASINLNDGVLSVVPPTIALNTIGGPKLWTPSISEFSANSSENVSWDFKFDELINLILEHITYRILEALATGSATPDTGGASTSQPSSSGFTGPIIIGGCDSHHHHHPCKENLLKVTLDMADFTASAQSGSFVNHGSLGYLIGKRKFTTFFEKGSLITKYSLMAYKEYGDLTSATLDGVTVDTLPFIKTILGVTVKEDKVHTLVGYGPDGNGNDKGDRRIAAADIKFIYRTFFGFANELTSDTIRGGNVLNDIELISYTEDNERATSAQMTGKIGYVAFPEKQTSNPTLCTSSSEMWKTTEKEVDINLPDGTTKTYFVYYYTASTVNENLIMYVK